MPRIAGRDSVTLIVQSAIQCFYDAGFEETTMEAIAARAGLTKRAVYYHFADKTALLHSALHAADDPALALLMAIAGPPVAGSLTSVKRLIAGLLKGSERDQFRGCLFLRASQVYPDDPQVLDLVSQHKSSMNQWLVQHVTQIGLRQPEAFANQLHLLIDYILACAHAYSPADLSQRVQASLEMALLQHPVSN